MAALAPRVTQGAQPGQELDDDFTGLDDGSGTSPRRAARPSCYAVGTLKQQLLLLLLL